MLSPAPIDYVFTCDECGATARAEFDIGPPPGFVKVDVHPLTGIGATHHACLGSGCLVKLAHRLRRDAARVVRGS